MLFSFRGQATHTSAVSLARTLGLVQTALDRTPPKARTVNVGAALLLLLLVVALAVAAYLFLRPNRTPRVRHPTIRSKSTVPSFQESNSAARLLAGVDQLKGHNATWPGILQTLNPEDSPQLRTVLLELRSLQVASPQLVLKAIEEACLASYRESGSLSRVDILDRAKARLCEARA